MKKITTLLTLCLLAFGLQAQISGALKIGGSGYQGDLHCRSDNSIGPFDDINPTFGLGVRLSLTQSIGLRADATYIRLSGDERQFDNAGHAARGWTLKNDFLEVAASLDWEIFGNKRFNENGIFKRVLTPVIFAGVGVAFTDAEVDFNNMTNVNIEKDRREANKARFVLPVGIGLKYYLSERFALALEGGVRMPVSDYYDGVSTAGNEDKNDMYGFGGLTASFLFGEKADADGDGISDKKDVCPDVPGLVQFSGCPDTDNDGIVDAEDSCPKVAGLVAFAGCPDTDSDGIMDKKDNCPNIAGLPTMNGCPDSDGDGVTDADDKCPEIAGGKATFGCPDSDGDGIVDKMDACPNIAGIADKKGCPFIDTDKDGLEDENDACPTAAGTLATNGCPDTDADGVADNVDKCPNVAGKMADGCPEVVAPPVYVEPSEVVTYDITEKGVGEVPPTASTVVTDANAVNKTAVSTKLKQSARQINFATGNALLTVDNKAHLDEIAFMMKNYPNQRFQVIGYTDSEGDALTNQQLSANRAKAAADYLISQGVNPANISFVGMGENNPIAPNKTAAGRKQNRRLEIVFNDGTIVGNPMGYINAAAGDCSCNGTNNTIFNLPVGKTGKALTKLGTNPEFGDSHGLDATSFYNKLDNAYRNNANDRQFLDEIFVAMGYRGFADASPSLFSEVVIPNGTTGNLGYSAQHKTLYATLNAALDKDLKAFRIRSANGCDLHFMKTCGNHFYFCVK